MAESSQMKKPTISTRDCSLKIVRGKLDGDIGFELVGGGNSVNALKLDE